MQRCVRSASCPCSSARTVSGWVRESRDAVAPPSLAWRSVVSRQAGSDPARSRWAQHLQLYTLGLLYAGRACGAWPGSLPARSASVPVVTTLLPHWWPRAPSRRRIAHVLAGRRHERSRSILFFILYMMHQLITYRGHLIRYRNMIGSTRVLATVAPYHAPDRLRSIAGAHAPDAPYIHVHVTPRRSTPRTHAASGTPKRSNPPLRRARHGSPTRSNRLARHALPPARPGVRYMIRGARDATNELIPPLAHCIARADPTLSSAKPHEARH